MRTNRVLAIMALALPLALLTVDLAVLTRAARASGSAARRVRRVKTSWAADARTLAAAIRFILAPAPRESRAGGLGLDNAKAGAIAAEAGWPPPTNRITLALLATPREDLGSGAWDGFERTLQAEIALSYKLFSAWNSMATNSPSPSNAPAAHYKAGLPETTEG